jgi:hypothetical protein
MPQDKSCWVSTIQHPNPWIKVALGKYRLIQKIAITNRDDELRKFHEYHQSLNSKNYFFINNNNNNNNNNKIKHQNHSPKEKDSIQIRIFGLNAGLRQG